MKNLSLKEIRSEFLKFFEKKNHLLIPSHSLIPDFSDKSLLFINSGMAPLKSYFMGGVKIAGNRAISCQKCIRTPDIENIGKTIRHCTFFEMLGNFSFGDYFKDKAIEFAVEFLYKFKIGLEYLKITTFEEDEETIKTWRKFGVDEFNIKKFGKTENFWEIGTGPCGPCTEIYFDLSKLEHFKNLSTLSSDDLDSPRFLEIWNLVFTQFYKNNDGSYSNLKQKNIDTGMGLERIALILGNKKDIFELSPFCKIIDKIQLISGIEYENNDNKIAFKIIADHLRSAVMLISDGIVPQNEGRGYVLRRLLRRAIFNGSKLNMKKFLTELIDPIFKEYENIYPELEKNKLKIYKTLKNEEEKFANTLNEGFKLIDNCIKEIKSRNETMLDGKQAFKLYDTYGIPIDLVKEIALESEITIDFSEYEAEKQNQKNLSKKSWSFKKEFGGAKNIKLKNNTFIGYDNDCFKTRILSIISDDKQLDRFSEIGKTVVLVLEKSIFYPESGGQVGDSGKIYSVEGATNTIFEVKDSQKHESGNICVIGELKKGTLTLDYPYMCEISKAKRQEISKNHTAAHLLHAALRKLINSNIKQMGSHVTDKISRFDFLYQKPLTKEEIKGIENEVNSKIFECLEVIQKEEELEKAIKSGAVALFGEKYDEIVKMVKIGNSYSFELCCGTHVDNTSKIGIFKILSETGVSANSRRIEYACGKEAFEIFKKRSEILLVLSQKLKSSENEIVTKIENLTMEIKDLEKTIDNQQIKIAKLISENLFLNNRYREISLSQFIDNLNKSLGTIVIKKNTLLSQEKNVYLKFISEQLVDETNTSEMRYIIDNIKNKFDNYFLIFYSKEKSVLNFVISSSKSMAKEGLNCSEIIKVINQNIGIKGGGKANFAQARGDFNASKIEFLKKIQQLKPS